MQGTLVINGNGGNDKGTLFPIPGRSGYIRYVSRLIIRSLNYSRIQSGKQFSDV
jgi:hypothetical protein